MKDGEEIQPAGPVSVRIELPDELAEDVKAIHFEKEEAPEVSKDQQEPATIENPVLLDAEVTPAEEMENAVVFETGGFSVFGVFGTTIEKTVLARNGRNYKITVTYGPEAKIPDDADLSVEEILPAENLEDGETDLWQEYVSMVDSALGWEDQIASYIRLFDIKIVKKGDSEIKYQAVEGTTVDVRIELADKEAGDEATGETMVVHFADGAETGDVVDGIEVAGSRVSFAADGFSVYAIVEAQEPAVVTLETVQNLAELAENLKSEFLLSTQSHGYFLNSMNKDSCFYTCGNNYLEADGWYFESAGGTDRYYLYTYVDDGNGNPVKRYVNNPSGNLAGLVENTNSAVTFELSQASEGKFYMKKSGDNRWLQYSDGGKGIRFYTANTNAGNAQITITYASSRKLPDDPYGLDGETFGIAYHNDSAIAAALMAETKDDKHLAGQDMLMRPDVLDNDGILLVAENSEIPLWTFDCVEEDKYYIKSSDGKYLTLNGQALTLSDEPDEIYSVFKAVPGTGANSGKYSFTVNGYSIELNGSAGSGFWGTNSNGATKWLNLVKKSDLNDDDFNLYTAKKVSVSDTENVDNGQKVVIYTRVWNDTKKKYEFYAVDYDGTLIPCYDTGDNIEWIGTHINTALWTFTEGTNSDGSLSYYFWLQNTQYDNYLVPQVSADTIFNDGAVLNDASINLNGRRYGQNYTTIIAWDDAQYAYSGLKVENGKVVPCALSEAQDFYFAIMEPRQTAPNPTTVATVDSNEYGITMKMIDFNDPSDNARNQHQTDVMGTSGGGKGLLSTDLDDDYPTVISNNKSLNKLFTSDSVPANHLFLQSVYNESGYFVYDSTQNFAHFDETTGNFTVYDQIGAIVGNEEHKNTREHGQFMPYNDISADKGYAIDSNGNIITNQTDVKANELSDLDARKGEKLYLIGDNNKGRNETDGDGVDYFFGMEMSASFTQTASGLDAWGHDIIFEFSGDDDFWLYVDGELVLDLGGVHSAQVGTVNFRTGVITSSNGNSTLYDTFRANYKARGMSEDEINAKLNEIFTTNENGQYVFTDYSEHTMRMFYMERGAGASNLKMRFNLAAVKPGNFVFSKQLSGTELQDNDLIEFPYQVWYFSTDDSEWHLLGDQEGESALVHYAGNTTPVKYAATFTPADGTEAYQHVFFLKPGQSAEVEMPEGAREYYVVECGINPDVYDEVRANNMLLSGEGKELTEQDEHYRSSAGYTVTKNTIGTTKRCDYKTSSDTTENRSRVDFDNHVSEGAMRTLSITKKLYNEAGEPLTYADDDTPFSFRLYLGDENSVTDTIPPANFYTYYVKDANDNYCRWDADEQKFVSLEITDYDGPNGLSVYLNTLSSTKREAIAFATSQYGSISKIPADHTVEVRQLIIGSKWKVEEQGNEIPRGYTLRIFDGYTRVDVSPEEEHKTMPNTGISGTMYADEDPKIEVRNQRGWGLTVQKIWTDKDFMQSHDDIFFAVYRKNVLLEDRVYRLPTSETEIYYFFDDLRDGEKVYNFEDFNVYEVTVTTTDEYGLEIDGDGKVTITENVAVTPITGEQDNNKLTVGGTPIGGTHQDAIAYMVSYQRGQKTGKHENVRLDTVTNSRPGIKLYKTLWDWEDPLAGAVFTLKDENRDDVAAPTYTSRASDGLITIAYLNPGIYTLTEIETAKGYVALDSPLTITVEEDNDGTMKVTSVTGPGEPNEYFKFQEAMEAQEATETTEAKEAEMAAITIRNRPAELHVVKADAENQEQKIEGVHFALYNQVTNENGEKVRDYLPINGYEDLETNGNGVPVKDGEEAITLEHLTWGRTYYLTETQAVGDYDKLATDLCFTIGKDGKVTINPEFPVIQTVTGPDDNTGLTTYTLTVLNGKMKNIRILKTDDAENTEDREPLGGAKFDLYTAEAYESEPQGGAIKTGMTSVSTGDSLGIAEIGLLPSGDYVLVETDAPSGYKASEGIILIHVDADSVSAKLKVTPEEGEPTESFISVTQTGEGADVIYTIPVTNELALKKIRFVKVTPGSTVDQEIPLAAATFNLYNGTQATADSLVEGSLTSGADGVLAKSSEGEEPVTVFELVDGTYILEETLAPAGYNQLSGYVTVTIDKTRKEKVVIYQQPDHGNNQPFTAKVKEQEDGTVIYEVKIYNNPGYELPSTGGPGTYLFYLPGFMLTSIAGAAFVMKRRRRKAA